MEAPSLDTFRLVTGRIISADSVVLLQEDRVLAAKGVAYTVVGVWTRGQPWYQGPVHQKLTSLAIVPPSGEARRQLVLVGPLGAYTVMAGGTINSDVIRSDTDFSAAACVENRVIAVGTGGRISRMESRTSWSDLTVPAMSDILEGITATPDGGFVVCGWAGTFAHATAAGIERRPCEASVILTSISANAAGDIVACGQGGTLVRGTTAGLQLIPTKITEDLWSVVHFQGEVYAASLTNLYRLGANGLERVTFNGDAAPTSFYALDTFEDAHLLSVGANDAVMFDGTRWSRVL